jgi:hypothetical protein
MSSRPKELKNTGVGSCYQGGNKIAYSNLFSVFTSARLAVMWIWALVIFYGKREVERLIMSIPSHTICIDFKPLRIYLRFSELNSDSRNRRNWSRPTWSFKISSKEKPHLFTRCWLGSLLWYERKEKVWKMSNTRQKPVSHSLQQCKSILLLPIEEKHLAL